MLRRRVVAVKKPAVRGGLGKATLQVVDEGSWQDECGGEYIINKKGIRVYLESKASNVSKSARKPDATATVRTKAIVPTNIGRTNPFPLEKLIVYLKAQQAARLQLSYKEIERICGCALPVAVYRNRAWWLTDGDKECSRKWSGYIVTEVAALGVVFSRLQDDKMISSDTDQEVEALRNRLNCVEHEYQQLRQQQGTQTAPNTTILLKEIEFLNSLVREQAMASKPRGGKPLPRGILLIGASPLNANTIYAIAKTLGIESQHLILHNDYETNKRYDFDKLRYNSRIGAVILGPIAHKVTGLGDYASVLQKLTGTSEYPKVFDARTCAGELKISKMSLGKALLAAKEYLEIVSCSNQ
ncbi:MAG: hypothetical protein WCP79_00070 [Bacillota bacterium]